MRGPSPRRPRRHLGTLALALTLGLSLVAVARAQTGAPRGPVIVPRPPGDPSIHEGFSGIRRAGFREVFPELGLLPASYDWFGGFLRAIGSLFQPYAGDPRYLGYLSGQRSPLGGYAPRSGARPAIRPGDTPSLGVICGRNPGDAFWVGMPRAPHAEVHGAVVPHQWDCFCRCDEDIDCPVPGPFLHRRFGGLADFRVNCRTCFSDARIVKHDVYVGTSKGSFPGYDLFQNDSGYQECLRQSAESFAGSGPGGSPRAPNIFGL